MNKKKKGFVIPEEKGVKKEKLNWFLRAITLGDMEWSGYTYTFPYKLSNCWHILPYFLSVQI